MSLLLNQFLYSDPQRNYKWRVTISGFEEFSADLIETADVPISPSFDEDTIDLNLVTVTYPSMRRVEQVTLTCMETADGTITQVINKWMNKMMPSNDGTFEYPINYEESIFIELMTGYNTVHTRIQLVGCWPVSSSPVSLDSAGNDKLSISVTFAVKDMKVDSINLLSALFDPNQKLSDLVNLPTGNIKLPWE